MKKSIPSNIKFYENICLELFWNIFAFKQSLFCAYFSPDSEETTFSWEKAILWMKNLYSHKATVSSLNDEFVYYKHSFLLHKMLIDGLKCELIVDYCDVFISCLTSHSDGTHSLQRIHWWVSDVLLNLSKFVPIKKQTHLDGLRKSKFSAILLFLGELYEVNF